MSLKHDADGFLVGKPNGLLTLRGVLPGWLPAQVDAVPLFSTPENPG